MEGTLSGQSDGLDEAVGVGARPQPVCKGRSLQEVNCLMEDSQQAVHL